MIDAEGSISIPLEDFWIFVSKYMPDASWEVAYGIPYMNHDSLVIDYAASTACHPVEWIKKPKAVLQWDVDKQLKNAPKRLYDDVIAALQAHGYAEPLIQAVMQKLQLEK